MLGTLKLSQLTVPLVRAFEDRLRADGRSPPWCARPRLARRHPCRRARARVGGAERRALVCAPAPARQRPARRQTQEWQAQDRRRHPNAGRDARDHRPARTGRWRPMLLTAIFTGLRASELRGLRWADVDLKRGEIHVRQRADRYNKIGPPKSEAGERTIPLPPMVVNALREASLACPKGELGLGVSQRARSASRTTPTSSSAASIRPRSRPRSPTSTARRNIPACTACAISMLVVHQPARRWRPRIAAQAGAGAAGSRLDPDDGGHLRPSVSARRRRRRACRGRESVSRRLKLAHSPAAGIEKPARHGSTTRG